MKSVRDIRSVKPLPWKHEGTYYRADAIVGTYTINVYEGMPKGVQLNFRHGSPDYFDSVEEAMSAAQQGYEQLIYSVLEGGAYSDVIASLVTECGARGYSFTLHWSEAEGCFYAESSGSGRGEFVEVKRAETMLASAQRLLALVQAEPTLPNTQGNSSLKAST